MFCPAGQDLQHGEGRFGLGLGTTLFKIANADLATSFAVGDPESDRFLGQNACRFGISEDWTGDLTNGILTLGSRARQLHGLDSHECGLLTMMRCYDSADRGHILRLFEQAATEPSRFCYSTTILSAAHQRQPVFCIGESTGFDGTRGTMVGLFIFPRFQLPTTATVTPV
ncbi:hypothetical protein FJQ55_04040 [Rhizobium glycinendophyticum]|uniref:Uncharacterized protein n=1 Tax=Rhizobium glycinendophyticum TaxID=2589807 RepID=A0A504UTS8_9HYPH|nr:hypothetical protein FJQ55_04040 [Rhizobium glycinendophyticum]